MCVMQSFLQYRRFGHRLRKQIESQGWDAVTGIQIPQPIGTNRSNLQNIDEEKSYDLQTPSSDSELATNTQKQAPQPELLQRPDGQELRHVLIGIERYKGEAAEDVEGLGDIFVVDFEGPDDPLSPQNWSVGRKWLYTGIVGSTGFLVSGASAFDSEITPQAARFFGVTEEVELLSTALFMIALGLGSLVSAPFSETVGRNPVYIICLTIFALFIMGAGLAPNIQTQLVCRFFAGLFGCPPLTTFGGSMSDMWAPVDRTYVFPILACFTFLGPFLAPMVADFIGPSPLVSWQWTEWTTLILASTVVAAIALFAPETYAPVLLSWKAQHLRIMTGDDRYRAASELRPTPFGTRLARSVARPIGYLLTEPIVDLFAAYLVVVYIILFGFLPGYDFIFGATGIYGFDQSHTGLCFLGMNVGFLLALLPIAPISRRYRRTLEDARTHGTGRVEPEERLWFAMLGAPFLPLSIFWMAWTAWPGVSFWSPLAASVAFGFAVECIFISCYQYIIDSYERFAASALVGMTVTRYCVAGPMVIVSVPLYENLGVHWALTLLGCVALVMTPVPYVFHRYGRAIRKKSRGAVGPGA